MAVLIQSERVATAWLAAARHLAGCAEYTERNLILEMTSAGSLAAQD